MTVLAPYVPRLVALELSLRSVQPSAVNRLAACVACGGRAAAALWVGRFLQASGLVCLVALVLWRLLRGLFHLFGSFRHVFVVFLAQIVGAMRMGFCVCIGLLAEDMRSGPCCAPALSCFRAPPRWHFRQVTNDLDQVAVMVDHLREDQLLWPRLWDSTGLTPWLRLPSAELSKYLITSKQFFQVQGLLAELTTGSWAARLAAAEAVVDDVAFAALAPALEALLEPPASAWASQNQARNDFFGENVEPRSSRELESQALGQAGGPRPVARGRRPAGAGPRPLKCWAIQRPGRRRCGWNAWCTAAGARRGPMAPSSRCCRPAQ